MKLGNVIVRPLITEKSTSLTGIDQYCFEVVSSASKGAVKKAIEEFFKVNVLAVSVFHYRMAYCLQKLFFTYANAAIN